ncbi:MAG: ABC transporter ATP-binding protein/permease, partial [Cytophagaceae bacterium]|nr:ABC transporter ATP-binding protein/permease [Cytophagaceae bacterium]
LLLSLVMIHSMVDYFHTYVSGWLGQRVVRDIRNQLFKHLLKFRLKFFDKTPIGRLMTRNISDVEVLSDVFSEGVASIIADLLQVIIIFVVMLLIDWRLTLYTLLIVPLLLLSTYVFKEKIKDSFNAVRTAVANLNTFVQEHITGMNIVQIFNSEEREFEKFNKINDEHRKANLKSVLYYSVYMPVADVLMSFGIGAIVIIGTWIAYDNPAMAGDNPGNFAALLILLYMFFRPIRMIADRFNTLQMAVVSSDRIFKLLDSNEEIPDNGMLKPESFKGEVEFKNVWFAYNEENYVLKDISFKVKQGEKLAMVGATGSGKSSAINLLNRFYEINKGEIKIDGIDIKEYDLDYLRSKIGVVLQDVFLFSDTIYNNITLHDSTISLERVHHAAELVGARKFIEKLPGGFDYNVMERGATLSVGQRQLISFVRAMVFDPKIIILDEATSSIDTETEELVQEAMEKLMKGRTSIVIAHRLSTIQNADKILVLDKGEIKESGRHEELLQNESWYAHLNKMQYKNLI